MHQAALADHAVHARLPPCGCTASLQCTLEAGGQRTAAGVPSFAVGVLPPQHLAVRPPVPLGCLPQQHHQETSAPAWLHSSLGCALQQAAPASAASGPHWTSLPRHTSCTVVALACAAAIKPLAPASQIVGREDTLPGCSKQGLRTLHVALAAACLRGSSPEPLQYTLNSHCIREI